MKQFLRHISPRRAMIDLLQVLGAPSEFRWPALGLALLVTGGIFWTMAHQGGRALPHPPTIVYFESWRADRTEQEIIAGNIAASRKARAEALAEERRAEDIRQMYKTLGSATGLDTERMYQRGKAERAAQARAQAASDKALLDRYLAKGDKPVVDPEAPATAN